MPTSNLESSISEKFLTIKQVADRLQVSERSVHRWISLGQLPHHRFGSSIRICPIDFEKFKRQRRQ